MKSNTKIVVLYPLHGIWMGQGRSIVCFLLFLFTSTACDHVEKSKEKEQESLSLPADHAPVAGVQNSKKKPANSPHTPLRSQTEQSMIDAGLIDIKSIDSSIVVDLKYSTRDNFLGMDVYGDFEKCYLQPDVAKKLKNASLFLQTKYPYYRLIVFDGVRPRSIQYQMWDTIKVPAMEKSKYLSNPKIGSLHNFGAAVDISIIDENGIILDMGTTYDYFGELAYPKAEDRMVKEGKLTRNQLLTRELLRTVMEHAGFFGTPTEWWHFNSCNRLEASAKYKIIE